MEIVNEKAQQYAEHYSSEEQQLLKEIAAHTLAHHAKSHMLSGHLQGKFLEMISCMINPQYVLEIGTFTGYSALCLAAGLKAKGELHTIELREQDAGVAKSFIKRSVYSEQIKIHIGDALSIVDELDYMWDLVFIDADKVSYIEYFNRVLPKVRKGGFILADNVLFHGQVLVPEIKGKNPKAIQAFNEFVQNCSAVENVLLPLRDGIYLIRKL